MIAVILIRLPPGGGETMMPSNTMGDRQCEHLYSPATRFPKSCAKPLTTRLPTPAARWPPAQGAWGEL